MGNLGGILGNLYGGDEGDGDDAPTAAGSTPPPAAAPGWADDDRLDAAFADWTPGPARNAPEHERDLFGAPPAPPAPPPLTTSADSDLDAALQAALAAAVAAADEPPVAEVAPVVDAPPAPESPAPVAPVLAPAAAPPIPVSTSATSIADVLAERFDAANADAQPEPVEAAVAPTLAPPPPPPPAYDVVDLLFSEQLPVEGPAGDAADEADAAGTDVDMLAALPAEHRQEPVAVGVGAPPQLQGYDAPAMRDTWVRGTDDVLPAKRGRRKRR